MYCYPRYHQLKKYVKTHVRFKIYCPCQREQTKHSNTATLLKVMHSCLQKYCLFLSIRRHPFTAAQVLLKVYFFFPLGKEKKYSCTWNITSKNHEIEYKTGTTYHLCIPSRIVFCFVSTYNFFGLEFGLEGFLGQGLSACILYK